VVGLRWNVIKTDEYIEATADTRFGSYTVGRCREDFDGTGPWGDWYWEYCFDDYYDESRSSCDSLEGGKQQCESHWLKTLVEGGVIEAVK
jgi:hypothetical protein